MLHAPHLMLYNMRILQACVLLMEFVYTAGPNALSSPKYVWPFCHLTIAYELANGDDAKYPKRKVCPQLAAGPPDYDFNVFVFAREPGSSASMKMAHTSIVSQFAFFFMIYPQDDNGVVLDYIADYNHDETIHSLTIEMRMGRIMISLRDDQGIAVDHARAIPILPHEQWSTVMVSWDEQGEVILQVNTSSVISHTVGLDDPRPLDSVGLLYVAEAVTDPSKQVYMGRFCCLAFFTSILPANTYVAEVMELFLPEKWPNPAPSGVNQQCSGSSVPVVVFACPLNNNSSWGYDVISGSPPVAPLNTQCMRHKHADLSGTGHSVYLDGSKLSYLTWPLVDDLLNHELTVAVSVRPDPPGEGVLWDYLAHPQKPDGVVRVTLTLVSGYAHLELYSNTGLCATLTSPHIVPSDEWSLIYVEMIPASESTMLWIDSTSTSVSTSSCSPASATPSSEIGTLTFGCGELGVTDVCYHGSAVCLVVSSGLYSQSQIGSDLTGICQTQIIGNNSGLCDVTPPLRYHAYTTVATDRSPDVTFQPISVRTVRSLLECSKWCLTSHICRAFTFHHLNGFLDQCTTYDFVTKEGLVVDTGNNYYEINPIE